MIEGVGDEEDGGGEGGGIATGTQKRGSKQGEALTSACFTLEREEMDRWKEDKQQEAGAVTALGQGAAAESKEKSSQSCGWRSHGRGATPPSYRSGCVRFASG